MKLKEEVWVNYSMYFNHINQLGLTEEVHTSQSTQGVINCKLPGPKREQLRIIVPSIPSTRSGDELEMHNNIYDDENNSFKDDDSIIF